MRTKHIGRAKDRSGIYIIVSWSQVVYLTSSAGSEHNNFMSKLEVVLERRRD